jgi:aspartyl-tRNA(Asn)/glutamyl-tRNA(Gln) amidotransferase subunit B
VPLVEMVTGPDLRSADEAAQYVIRLRQLLRWLDVSEADLERAHLRCDANVSIRPMGVDYLNPKTEIKNVNSIVSLREAIQAEIERQVRQVEAGKQIEAWTLEWDEEGSNEHHSGVLRKMRSKETEADYRYFHEPDLLPVRIDESWKATIIQNLPELPLERRARFTHQYGLPEYDADILTSDRSLSDYLEAAVSAYGGDPKRVSNWVMNDVLRMLNERSLSAGDLRLRPEHLAEIIQLVDNGSINISTGKSLLEKVESSGNTPAEIVQAEGLGKVSDVDAIRSLCRGAGWKVLSRSPHKTNMLIGWFAGNVMKKSRGKADPQLAKPCLSELMAIKQLVLICCKYMNNHDILLPVHQ